MRRLLLTIALLGALLAARGAEADSVLRPVLSQYMFELGSAHRCDTYLTPLHYSGWQAALSYSRMQALRFNPERWTGELGGRLSLDRTLNPAGTAVMWSITFNPHWTMLWRTRPWAGFTLGAGGRIDALAGALWLARNANNPIAARGALTIGPAALAAWNGHIGPLPVTLSYRPWMPLTGIFFSPDYDELYYEIWLGNHSGLVHGAWPGNYFRLDNLVCADLHLGNTTLRLGYRCDIMSTKTSGIVTREVTHTFVLGLCTEWISLRAGRRHTPDARIISALYQ